MKIQRSQSFVERRSFLARLGAGVGLAGVAVAGSTTASAQSTGSTSWQPARHEQDDWLDKIPGRHRFIFDTTTPDGMSSGLLFATNYLLANQSGYGLTDSDLAVVIVARHTSTAFALNDSMWGKYGAELSRQTNFLDPRTKEAPRVNVYATSGGRLDSLLKKGVHLAVCQMATRAIAGSIARATGGNTDSVYSELASNLVSNSHLVPAGIVVLNRAQERGYAFVYAV
jgi:intracellular sulfur oxidation DsrE/DsrF family protein